MPKEKISSAQILLFPDSRVGNSDILVPASHQMPNPHPSNNSKASLQPRQLEVVLSGSFRKDLESVKRDYELLRNLGCRILSPVNVQASREEDGFVFMRGEETQKPEDIELRHLDAIQKAKFVWLHAPAGYVGPSGALEIGFARAVGIPVFSTADIADPIVRSFVQRVSSPEDALNHNLPSMPPPAPAVQSFQHYYRHAAIQRGYHRESAQNCLLLMLEEVGELARAIRKREKLKRHKNDAPPDEAMELADVFIYVVHMANILQLDLSKVVQQKELLNIQIAKPNDAELRRVNT
jgi:NTP pyrophosphatase (non-canonical NTP hydrolase)